jgi:LuxR family transcriptional regulator, quorum-sensing system regulator BjaR1
MDISDIAIGGVEQLVASGHVTALLDNFGETIAALGGTAFAVAALPQPGAMRVAYHRGLNGWVEHFVGSAYAKICPVTAWIGERRHPFMWRDVWPTATTRQMVVRDAAHEFGLDDGLIVPVTTMTGLKGNVFVRTGAALDEDGRALLTLLSMVMHSQLMTLTFPVPDGVDISEREREVLLWLADGKSSEDVADILGLSVATVMFHYRNISERFGTLTRAHTVAEGFRRGVLPLQ